MVWVLWKKKKTHKDWWLSEAGEIFKSSNTNVWCNHGICWFQNQKTLSLHWLIVFVLHSCWKWPNARRLWKINGDLKPPRWQGRKSVQIQTTSASYIDSKTNNTPTAALLLRLGLRRSFEILIKNSLCWNCLGVCSVFLYFESHYCFSYAPDLIKYSEGHLMTSKLGQNNVPFGDLAFGIFPALFFVLALPGSLIWLWQTVAVAEIMPGVFQENGKKFRITH